MLPWKILNIETTICAIWGILEANLKISSTLKLINEYHFCTFNLHSQIYHLNFHRKKVFLLIFAHRRYFFPWFSISISTGILVSAIIPGHDKRNVTVISLKKKDRKQQWNKTKQTNKKTNNNSQMHTHSTARNAACCKYCCKITQGDTPQSNTRYTWL